MIKCTFEEGLDGRKPPFPPLVVDEVTFKKLFIKYKDMSYDTKNFWASSFKIWPYLIIAAVFMLFFNGSWPVQIILVVYAITSVKMTMDIYTFELGVFERWLNREQYIVKYVKEYIKKYDNMYAYPVRDNSL